MRMQWHCRVGMLQQGPRFSSKISRSSAMMSAPSRSAAVIRRCSRSGCIRSSLSITATHRPRAASRHRLRATPEPPLAGARSSRTRASVLAIVATRSALPSVDASSATITSMLRRLCDRADCEQLRCIGGRCSWPWQSRRVVVRSHWIALLVRCHHVRWLASRSWSHPYVFSGRGLSFTATRDIKLAAGRGERVQESGSSMRLWVVGHSG